MISIADLALDITDNIGSTVRIIYAKKPPDYAVYASDDRVLVMFADDPAVADAQRARLASLNPVRGEINGLVDRWRAKIRTNDIASAYDRRVADAMIVGFESDAGDAAILLNTIKRDILDQRIANARFEYLVAAFATGIAAMLLVALFARLDSYDGLSLDLARAAAAGAVGAFFSISLAIRGRTVLPDLQRMANLMDATLRMIIGVIAATALMALVDSGAVSVVIGDANLANGKSHWLLVLLYGFIAGFSERFVPDLLAKASATTNAPPPPPPPPPPPLKDKASDAAGTSTGATTPPPAVPDDPLPEQAAIDDCACDIDLPADELTDDADLPAASGGVARAPVA